jgi:hypothetical protein
MIRRLLQILTAISAAATPVGACHRALASEEDADRYIKEATAQVEFVIVKSTANYDEARGIAAEASKRLRAPMKLRDLAPTSKGGLSFPKGICEENGWDSPCYVARGRYDDGAYVSIEHTSGYPEFKPNFYIVVVASDRKGSALIKKTAREAQKIFPDAYTRVAQVYMGCIH